MHIRNLAKRGFDLFMSLLAIMLLIPIWLVLTICIFVENPGSIIFRQLRPGKDGKLFIIYKFRSMYINSVPPMELGAVKHNHSLVTRVGHFIRRFKLDETPQFYNVLKGEMSLIGPRPCLPDRIASMTEAEKRRFHMLPGISGWAEVNGNVDLTWEEQLLLDLWYVDHFTLKLDLAIFIKTIKVVLCGSVKNEQALNAATNRE